MKHQCLISSYEKDFVWLGPCLSSLKKFSRGFLSPVISVATSDFEGARRVVDRHFPEATVIIKDGPVGKGNLRAQVSMMKSDLLCPHADYIWLVGSDCLVSSTFTPEPFFMADQPVMLMNSYNHLAKFHVGTLPWRDGVNNALGFRPDFEYMRRLPLMYHRDVFSATRGYIEWLHKKSFEDYVYSVGNDPREHRSDSANFSESNVLGAYAHRFMPGKFRWMDLDGSDDHYGTTMERFPNPMIQFWSHGGLDFPCDCSFNYRNAARDGQQVPWNCTFGKTPRHVITDILGPDALA
jgi:hypothetical protein